MAANFYQKQQREYEKMLSRLEKSYDKDNAYIRQYASDCVTISTLVKEGVIDREHGELLWARAKARFQAEEDRRKAERLLATQGRKDYEILRAITVFIGLVGVLFFILLTKSCGPS